MTCALNQGSDSANPGKRSAATASQVVAPSPTTAATRVDEIDLDIEASWKTVSGVTGSDLPTSRTPNASLIDDLIVVDNGDRRAGHAGARHRVLNQTVELGQGCRDLVGGDRRFISRSWRCLASVGSGSGDGNHSGGR